MVLYYDDYIELDRYPITEDTIIYFIRNDENSYAISGVSSHTMPQLSADLKTRAPEYIPIRTADFLEAIKRSNLFQKEGGEVILDENQNPLLPIKNNLTEAPNEDSNLASLFYQPKDDETKDDATPDDLDRVILTRGSIDKATINQLLKYVNLDIDQIPPVPFPKLVTNEDELEIDITDEELDVLPILTLNEYLAADHRELVFNDMPRRRILHRSGILEAFRDGWISSEQAVFTPLEKLDLLLNENGLMAISMYTDFEKASSLYLGSLKLLLTNEVICAANNEPNLWEGLASLGYSRLQILLDNDAESVLDSLQKRADLFTTHFLKEIDLIRLKILTLNNGFEALTDKLIPPAFVKRLDPRSLQLLLTPEGIEALDGELVTVESVLNVPPENLKLLLTANGCKALNEGLITPQEAEKLGSHVLKKLLDNDFKLLKSLNVAIEDKLLEKDTAFRLPYSHLSLLLTKEGLSAINQGLITPEIAKTLSERRLTRVLQEPDFMCLRIIQSDAVQSAIASNLLSFDEAAYFSADGLRVLCNKDGLRALKNGFLETLVGKDVSIDLRKEIKLFNQQLDSRSLVAKSFLGIGKRPNEAFDQNATDPLDSRATKHLKKQ